MTSSSVILEECMQLLRQEGTLDAFQYLITHFLNTSSSSNGKGTPPTSSPNSTLCPQKQKLSEADDLDDELVCFLHKLSHPHCENNEEGFDIDGREVLSAVEFAFSWWQFKNCLAVPSTTITTATARKEDGEDDSEAKETTNVTEDIAEEVEFASSDMCWSRNERIEKKRAISEEGAYLCRMALFGVDTLRAAHAHRATTTTTASLENNDLLGMETFSKVFVQGWLATLLRLVNVVLNRLVSLRVEMASEEQTDEDDDDGDTLVAVGEERASCTIQRVSLVVVDLFERLLTFSEHSAPFQQSNLTFLQLVPRLSDSNIPLSHVWDGDTDALKKKNLSKDKQILATRQGNESLLSTASRLEVLLLPVLRTESPRWTSPSHINSFGNSNNNTVLLYKERLISLIAEDMAATQQQQKWSIMNRNQQHQQQPLQDKVAQRASAAAFVEHALQQSSSHPRSIKQNDNAINEAQNDEGIVSHNEVLRGIKQRAFALALTPLSSFVRSDTAEERARSLPGLVLRLVLPRLAAHISELQQANEKASSLVPRQSRRWSYAAQQALFTSVSSSNASQQVAAQRQHALAQDLGLLLASKDPSSSTHVSELRARWDVNTDSSCEDEEEEEAVATAATSHHHPFDHVTNRLRCFTISCLSLLEDTLLHHNNDNYTTKGRIPLFDISCVALWKLVAPLILFSLQKPTDADPEASGQDDNAAASSSSFASVMFHHPSVHAWLLQLLDLFAGSALRQMELQDGGKEVEDEQRTLHNNGKEAAGAITSTSSALFATLFDVAKLLVAMSIENDPQSNQNNNDMNNTVLRFGANSDAESDPSKMLTSKDNSSPLSSSKDKMVSRELKVINGLTAKYLFQYRLLQQWVSGSFKARLLLTIVTTSPHPGVAAFALQSLRQIAMGEVDRFYATNDDVAQKEALFQLIFTSSENNTTLIEEEDNDDLDRDPYRRQLLLRQVRTKRRQQCLTASDSIAALFRHLTTMSTQLQQFVVALEQGRSYVMIAAATLAFSDDKKKEKEGQEEDAYFGSGLQPCNKDIVAQRTSLFSNLLSFTFSLLALDRRHMTTTLQSMATMKRPTTASGAILEYRLDQQQQQAIRCVPIGIVHRQTFAKAATDIASSAIRVLLKQHLSLWVDKEQSDNHMNSLPLWGGRLGVVLDDPMQVMSLSTICSNFMTFLAPAVGGE